MAAPIKRPTVVLKPGAPLNPTAENVYTTPWPLPDGRAGVLIPVFVGPEPAERFLESHGELARGMSCQTLEGVAGLKVLLVNLKARGTTHVSYSDEYGRSNPIAIPIDDAIAGLHG